MYISSHDNPPLSFLKDQQMRRVGVREFTCVRECVRVCVDERKFAVYKMYKKKAVLVLERSTSFEWESS